MKLLALVLTLFAPLALATDLTIRCTPPTQNADGTSIASDATLGYLIYGATQGQPLVLLTPTPPTACLNVRQNVNPGPVCYAGAAVETLGTIVSDPSAQTAPVCVTVPAAPPSPGGVTVTLASTSTIVYALVNGENTFAPLIVGSAPLATSCDVTHSAQAGTVAYYVIPWSAVTYSGALKPHTVYANCS